MTFLMQRSNCSFRLGVARRSTGTRPQGTDGGIIYENHVRTLSPAILSEGHYTL